MKPIPKTLTAMGHTFKVLEVDDLANMGKALAAVDTDNLLIFVDSSKPEQVQWASFVHEMVEIINEFMELDLKHNLIQKISAGISSILLENGMLNDGKKTSRTKKTV